MIIRFNGIARRLIIISLILYNNMHSVLAVLTRRPVYNYSSSASNKPVQIPVFSMSDLYPKKI